MLKKAVLTILRFFIKDIDFNLYKYAIDQNVDPIHYMSIKDIERFQRNRKILFLLGMND